MIVKDEVYHLMTELEAALNACAEAGSINEADTIKFSYGEKTVGDLLDQADNVIIRYNRFGA